MLQVTQQLTDPSFSAYPLSAVLCRGKSVIAQRAEHADTTGFADCAPVHVLSRESLLDLSDRIPADATDIERPVSFRRFRLFLHLRFCLHISADSG